MPTTPEPVIGQAIVGAPLLTGGISSTAMMAALVANNSGQEDYLDSDTESNMLSDKYDDLSASLSNTGSDMLYGDSGDYMLYGDRGDDLLLDSPMLTSEEANDVIEPFGSKNNDLLLIVVLAGLLWYIYSKRR